MKYGGTRSRQLSKKTFADRIGKSTRTVNRWISTGVIPNSKVFRDPTGHVYIHESAMELMFDNYRMEVQNEID